MNTMDALLVAIESADADVIRLCAKAVLKSTFDRLFLIEPEHSLSGDGTAMATILVCAAELDLDFTGGC